MTSNYQQQFDHQRAFDDGHLPPNTEGKPPIPSLPHPKKPRETERTLPKQELFTNPAKKLRINLVGRYISCPTSGYRELNSVHGLVFLPIKRGKNYYYASCFCGTRINLTPQFDPTQHGLTFEQAYDICQRAIADGMGGMII